MHLHGREESLNNNEQRSKKLKRRLGVRRLL